MLPGMNGIQLAQKLREDGFPRTPMIAISASRSMLQAARESHLFDEALRKPFELSNLLDAIEQYWTSA
jgi:CheY-like chemotaxis protein